MLHQDDFAFLCVTNNTKLERLHQAASRTITDIFSFLSILLLSEASVFFASDPNSFRCVYLKAGP